MWRGDALADVAYEPFAQPEIRRLEDLRLTVVEARAEADLALARHGSVAGELETLVARHPARERLCELLMVSLYRSGRQADALDAYQRTRAYLDDELGLEPGAPLKTLQAAVLAQSPLLAPPPRARRENSSHAPAHGVPA